MQEIINKVELSGILTLDLLQYKPHQDQIVIFDIVPYLLHDYLLQEKVFRAEMAKTDWSIYQHKEVILCCSNDAIVPYWAYVFITSLLQPYASQIIYNPERSDNCKPEIKQVARQHTDTQLLWAEKIRNIDYQLYTGKKVVLKASSAVPPELFVIATRQLMKYVQSLMWGEAGSPLMIFKKKKTI